MKRLANPIRFIRDAAAIVKAEGVAGVRFPYQLLESQLPKKWSYLLEHKQMNSYLNDRYNYATKTEPLAGLL
jgi:hypothetical protein